jgi:hypothetical protein
MLAFWSAHALDGERSSATQDKASSATAPSAPTMPPLQLCHLADHTWLALTRIAADIAVKAYSSVLSAKHALLNHARHNSMCMSWSCLNCCAQPAESSDGQCCSCQKTSASRFRSLCSGVRQVRSAGKFPVFVDAGKGAHFSSIDGHDYIDFCLGDTGAMAGHAPDACAQVCRTQE